MNVITGDNKTSSPNNGIRPCTLLEIAGVMARMGFIPKHNEWVRRYVPPTMTHGFACLSPSSLSITRSRKLSSSFYGNTFMLYAITSFDYSPSFGSLDGREHSILPRSRLPPRLPAPATPVPRMRPQGTAVLSRDRQCR
jgi:hypothetical protein